MWTSYIGPYSDFPLIDKYIWDKSLEILAELRASNCESPDIPTSSTDDLFGDIDGTGGSIDESVTTFERPALAQDLGQNLAWSDILDATRWDVLDLIDSWLQEGSAYDYGTVDGTEVCDLEFDVDPLTRQYGCRRFTHISGSIIGYISSIFNLN